MKSGAPLSDTQCRAGPLGANGPKCQEEKIQYNATEKTVDCFSFHLLKLEFKSNVTDSEAQTHTRTHMYNSKVLHKAGNASSLMHTWHGSSAPFTFTVWPFHFCKFAISTFCIYFFFFFFLRSRGRSSTPASHICVYVLCLSVFEFTSSTSVSENQKKNGRLRIIP